MTMERDDWVWNPEGPFHPLFERESKRRDFLRAKQPLTALEAKELADGYLPFAYVGATYHGHPVKVTRLMDGTNDRTPYLLNDPNQWINLSPPFSVKNWPQGPPGWIMLTPGVHYSTERPQIAGADRLRFLSPPWDVGWNRMLLESIPGGVPGTR
jgi:hypothetical protein